MSETPTKPHKATAEQLADCEAALHFWLAKAKDLWPGQAKWIKPELHFDLNGLSAGMVVVKRHPGLQIRIRINQDLLARYPKETLEETVPHEVAHYVAYLMHGKLTHGAEWRAIMEAFGKPATRCHQMQATPARRHKRHTYICDCQDHLVSTRMHNRIRRGNVYLCRSCQAPLKQAA